MQIEQYKYLSQRLSKTDMKKLNLNGLHTIVNPMRNSLPFAWKVYWIFRNNYLSTRTIKEHLNLKYLIEKIKDFYRDKKYEVKS